MMSRQELLKDPSIFAHRIGRKLKRIRSNECFYQMFDYYLNIIVTHYDEEEICRIIKTWMKIYDMYFDVNQVDRSIYNSFEQKCQPFIKERLGDNNPVEFSPYPRNN